ncbi:MAG TPA: CCA tRNA nucleotidyltransferase, partial [Rhodobiaceae bacterium]|nr:CCA tRNA nucleotidyltransferase [Rhodobiaceae bacterium]
YADSDGVVYDPLEARGTSGLVDLEAGIVRFIGDPDTRIAEDYLRVLRFFRFSAQLQPDAPDEKSLEACARAANQNDGLSALSGERLAQELFKLLAQTSAPQALELMQQAGLLPFVFPFTPAVDIQIMRLANLIDIQETQFFEADYLLRLAALCPDSEAVIDQLSEKLRFSKKQTKRLRGALDTSCHPVCYMSAREMRRALYVSGREAFIDRCFLIWAMDKKTNNAVQWRALIAMATSWEKPDFPLTGDMMKTAGVPEGPEMGRVSEEVERWWIDSDFTDDTFSIIERLKAVVQATIL